MRYVSIDIETTGLDPMTCQVIEMAAIIDDTAKPIPIEELPMFQAYILHDQYVGEPFALAMNAAILKKIANAPQQSLEPVPWVDLYLKPHEIWGFFKAWLEHYKIDTNKVIAAGKNFAGFDKQFLLKLGYNNGVKFHHRSIDPAMFYMDRFDSEVPSTAECMKRAGIEGEVQHRALDDARDVIKLIRKHFPIVGQIC